MSRFYIQNNRAIDHPEELDKKRDINNFAFEASRNQNQKFQGNVYNRRVNRTDQPRDINEEQTRDENTR